MDLPRPIPDTLVELIAQRFRVIGDPMRIRLLDALRDGPATVGDLHGRLGGGDLLVGPGSDGAGGGAVSAAATGSRTRLSLKLRRAAVTLG